MGEKDKIEKLFLDYEDVFADIINVLLYNGRQVIKPEELVQANVISHYKADDSIIHEQERDIAKFWVRDQIRHALLGIENQTTTDNDIALRVMGYDGASYRGQLLSEHKEPPYPVCTLVLYFGGHHWKNSRSLKERICANDQLKNQWNDYPVRIFEISFLEEEQVKMFQSDFGIVADYFVKRKKGIDYEGNQQEIKHVDAMMKFMAVFAGDQEFLKLNFPKGGKVTMCEVVQKIKEKGRIEGRVEGESIGIIKGKLEGRRDDILGLLADTGQVPEYLNQIIMKETDQNKLKQWLFTAARSSSIEEFERNIE
ncbi:MAG: Rpn family recombination-promoting nuclease/putative transposase [Anaerostipes faecalis]|nr:Rpn family recombination-promoting nuclease/putative transposase [Anaerostipes faecalis]